jgi:lipopolysaccharide transport protein LptA
MNTRIIAVILSIGLVTGWAVGATEQVQVKSEQIWGDTKKNITYLEGNVQLTQGQTLITTEKAEVDQDKKVAFFKNDLLLTHPDVTISAHQLEYNLKKQAGTFSENVVLSRNEVQDKQGKVIKDAFTLRTAKLYFESDTKNFIAQSEGEVEHKDFTGTANTIEYNDRKQELLLKGNAKLRRPGGEEITGEVIAVNTQNNNLSVPNKVKLVNQDVVISADRLDYDYKQKHGTFTKHVVLNRTETKDANGKVTKDPFKLVTDGLYFESESKNFLTQSRATVENKDFNGSADQINYDDGLQQLKFMKNAQLKRQKGETVSGDLIAIDIKDKSFTVNSHVAVEFKVDTEPAQPVKGDRR